MAATSFLTIRDEIKKILKTRKVRYGQLAAQLGMSESGIKKMLNGPDLSFNKITAVLDVAGVSVSEFFQILDERKPQVKRLTPKQEAYFLKNTHAYDFFYQLLELHLDWRKVKRRHGLSQKSVDAYLFALDKIGAIELHPGQVLKSEYAGNCRLSFGMPLVKKVVDRKHRALLEFAHIPQEKFRDRKYLVNGALCLKPATARELNASLKSLVGEYMNRAQRENIVDPEEVREEIGFLFVVTPTTGMPHEKIPEF